MNSTELAVLRQRCDRGEAFTAEEMEHVLRELSARWDPEDDCGLGCEFCGPGCGALAEDDDDLS